MHDHIFEPLSLRFIKVIKSDIKGLKILQMLQHFLTFIIILNIKNGIFSGYILLDFSF